jgi:hypothetical protein
VKPVIYCADIGSVPNRRFGWARSDTRDDTIESHRGGTEIIDLVDTVAADIAGGQAVALGFECPLFVPVPEQALRLGAARPGEKNRSWSAGRGRWGDRDWHRRSGVGTEYRAGEVGDPRWLVVARTARYG